MAIKEIVAGILKPAADLASEFIEDKDKANEVRAKLILAQGELQEKLVQYESDLVQARSQIVQAEANSESWLARNWRPMTMLTFVGLVVAKWLGFTAEGVSEAIELELMALIQIGLGGYVVGRSTEKIAPHLKEVFRK